jgi:hypothetical protein
MVARSGPPAYAWDWFARQRLPWREVRSRLAASRSPVAARYTAVETRNEVMALLRADLPRDPDVRRVVDEVVAEVVFLGRTDRRFAELGLHSAPRGMRWWWTALTGEDLDAPRPHGATPAPRTEEATAEQLHLVAPEEADEPYTLDDVLGGYGG